MPKKWTDEIFKKEMFDRIGDEYKVLGKYKSHGVRVEVEHNCGHCYYIYPTEFLRKGLGRCTKCRDQRIEEYKAKSNISNEKFKRIFKDKVGEDYEVLSDYKCNSQTMIEVRHIACGCIYKINAYNFITDRTRFKKCPICYEHYNLTTDMIRIKLNLLYDNRFDLIDEYKTFKTKLTIKCRLCDETYKISPFRLFNGEKIKHNCAIGKL